MFNLRCLIPLRFTRTLLFALLLALLAFAVQPPQPAYAAWTADCSIPANVTAMGITEAQCDSLRSIYDNFGGDGWGDGSNGSGAGAWGEATDVDTWYGVTRTGTNVTAISMNWNNLVGNIQDIDLSGLTNLQNFDLSSNQIGGSIDGLNLSGLSSLQDLRLSNNQIGGNIDGLNLTGLSSLETINMSYNQIGGNIDGLNLSGLSSLRLLVLYFNQIGGNIDGLNLSGLSSLQNLYLWDNQIGGNIDGLNLSGVPNLLWLALNNNQIGGNIDGLNLTGLSSLQSLQLYDNQIGGNIDGLNLTGLSSLASLRLYTNQIGGNIDGLNLTGLSSLQHLYLNDNQIGGDPSGITGIPASLERLYLQDNQMTGTVPDLTGTAIASAAFGYLQLCDNSAINPSGTAAIDTFAETNDSTGWTAASGCGVTGLVTSAACNGDDLDVTITTGDGPFNITGTGGAGLPQNGVHIGLITLPGPDSWTAVTVTETTDDLQSANLGDFNCPAPNLAATTACNGDDLNITITAGDANFDISADDPAAANQAQNGVALGGPYTLVSSGGGGQWTNITITELGGNTETLNLPDTTCPPPAAASSSGGSAPSAQASASCITIDVEADREVVAIGDPVKWTLAVRNSCTNVVDNVIVSGQLPGSLTPLDLTTSRGEISRPLPDFEVQLGMMQPQEIVEMWIDSRVVAGAGLTLPEGAAGQSAGQTICLTGLVTGSSDTDCVSLFPDTLPATGGEPVKTWGWWWLTAGILAVGGGLWVIQQRTRIC